MKEIIDRRGREKIIPETGLGFTEPDPRIKDGDRTHCHVCGREVSIQWNFCEFCGTPISHQSL